MAYEDRQKLIAEIEKLRESRVIALVTGDRLVAPTQIADDALRPLYEHLRKIRSEGPAKTIDLLLYTRGGPVETPWKLVSKIRQFCEKFAVMVPYRAHSAGTMIAMGADEIIMSSMAELGPIDPFLQVQPSGEKPTPFLIPDLGVEDMTAYISFLRQRAGITDQGALAETMKVLAEHLTPTLLGRMERIYSHIRLVARKLLALTQPPMPDSAVSAIVEALTEKMFAHGHGIGVAEAQSIGLNAKEMDGDLDRLVWDLYLDYESTLSLDTNPDPRTYFPDDDTNVYFERDATGVCVESLGLLHVFKGDIRFERVRKMPGQLTINLNFPINLPPTVSPQQLPQQLQAAIQQILQQATQQLHNMVQQEVARQAPVERIGHGWFGGTWIRVQG